MKFNFENIKTTFQNFNIYQKIAGVVLAVSIPVCIGLGMAAVTTGTTVEESSSLSQLVSSVVHSSSVVQSSSQQSSSSKPSVKIFLLPSSVEEDLEVKVVGENGQMIEGPEFELVVKGVKNGYNKTWKVNDGFLRLTKLPSGDYTVSIKEKDGYIIPDQDVKITVAKKVEYKEVDVSDKVVDESKVDVSKEDAAYDDQVAAPAATPAPIQDTVEYVQSIVPFTDGTAVKITIAQYFTPRGVCIHGTGVVPDVEVELDEALLQKVVIEHEEDNQLQAAIRHLLEKIK